MKRSTLLIGVAIAASAGAATRGDFGYEWPLVLSQQAGAQRLDLPPEVYAHLSDRGLRDLDAFNAQGEPLPFGTIPEPAGPATPPPAPARMALPWFALPATPDAATGGDVHLRIERDRHGALRRVDADVTSGDRAREPQPDVLVDATTLPRAFSAIELSWPRRDGPAINAHFEVLAGEDLEHWRPLAPEASVVDLSQNGFALQRRRIDLPTGRAHYLLLHRLDAGAPVPIDGVNAVLVADASDVRSKPVTVAARPSGSDPKLHAWDFAAPGPIPSVELTLELASVNSVANVQVLSRDRDDGYWQLRAAFTAFRVRGAAGEATHETQAIGYSRDRQWRVIADPPLDASPTLKLSYRPDTFVVLPRGAEPYVLVAGSASARRADYPMEALLSALSRVQHEPAALPLAQLGGMRVVQGEAAMRAPVAGPPTRKWVLWATLALGAAAVLFMVLNLIRQPPPSP